VQPEKKKKKRSRTIIRLFLIKKKSTSTVSRACGNKLACFILVITSYKRACRGGLKSKPPDVNIREQQTISQLIISD
jgi:hypothetical protein